MDAYQVQSRYQVQDCGCIALPEEIQQRTGLRPGATFDIEVLANGNVTLHLVQPASTFRPVSGAACKTQSSLL
jgi:hypothetical protein